MKVNYSVFGIVTDCGVFDVTACDMESAKADVMAAFPDCRIVQVVLRGWA